MWRENVQVCNRFQFTSETQSFCFGVSVKMVWEDGNSGSTVSCGYKKSHETCRKRSIQRISLDPYISQLFCLGTKLGLVTPAKRLWCVLAESELVFTSDFDLFNSEFVLCHLLGEQGAQGERLWEGDFWRRVIKRQALATSCAGCIIASGKDVSEVRLWKCILWNTLWSAPSHCCWMLVWHIAGLAVEYQVPGRSGLEDAASLWQPSVRISKACILVQMALCTG